LLSSLPAGTGGAPTRDDPNSFQSSATLDAHTPPGALGDAAGASLAAGTRINQYELIRELGRGGMGCVYLARDTRLGRRVAMKFLLHASKSVADRFLVEARATARCSHENIVIIHEVDEHAGAPYMVLEFLEGTVLRELLGSRLTPSRAVELVLPVARALARAHEFDIVHRDLKPDNVIVTSSGVVKVLDFGIAKALGTAERQGPVPLEAVTDDLRLTRDGAIVGTLPYMAPEQFGFDTVDHRSDLWSVGIMLWEMLAARHPVEPLSQGNLVANASNLDQPMPSIRSVAPDVPEMLARVVDGCLRKRKAERIGSAAELVAALEALLPGRRGRQLAEAESPYPGLTAFQEADADRFFGRTRDVARMTARIREHPLTGVVGPSGVGKSSFIRAGVGPALKASGEAWSVVTLRPGRSPLVALASVLQKLTTTRSGTNVDTRVDDHGEIVMWLRKQPGFLGDALRARARQTQSHILLFVDQFEELYTLVPSVDERKAFTAALAGVADDTQTPLRVVVSMRADFLDRVAEDQRFMEELGRGLVFLAPPDRVGLREALVQPVEMVDFRFESAAMVEDMLDALDGTPGALPLLQFAAAKLWDARDRERRVLTAASYAAIGGISGALATHADDVLIGMDPAAQKLTRQIFQRLITPERTRAIVEIADLEVLADRTEVNRVLDQLVSARLLVVQTRSDAGGGSVEIVHESLIERWPTLQRWLDEDQEDAAFVHQLRTAAKQWAARGQASGLLWRGEAMEEARHWLERNPRELPAREQQFLDAVFALATRGKRLRRVALVAAFVTMGAVTAGAGVAFLWIRSAEQRATEQKNVAEQREQDAVEALAAAEEKERQRQAAEAGKSEAERGLLAEEEKKRAAEAEVAKRGAQLAQSYEELKAALAAAEAAKDRAENESKRAARAADEAKREKERAEDASKKLAEKNRALEDKLKKLSTTLK
jgi:serine/threonine protein kinase